MQSRLPLSSKILFISDVHLGAFSDQKNSEIEEDLIKLINYAEQHLYQIVILGDLFDYWIEYPNFTPSLGEKMLQRFRQFNRQNTAILYITGNHDNWTLGHFTEIGFDVEPESRVIHINENTILLLHGDATGDSINHLKRPLLHRIIRNRFFLKVYRSVLSPSAGLKVMQIFSKFTRVLGDETEDTTPLNTWSKKMLKQSDIDYIICGHDHSPRCLKYDSGTYLNCGSFCDHRSMVAYNNGQFKLVSWNSNNQELTPFQKQASDHE